MKLTIVNFCFCIFLLLQTEWVKTETSPIYCNFRKIFRTPRDDRPRRNYDDLQILERASFHSEESPKETATEFNRIIESPKAAANAHISVRFGDVETSPNTPTVQKSPASEDEAFYTKPMADAIKKMLVGMMIPYLASFQKGNMDMPGMDEALQREGGFTQDVSSNKLLEVLEKIEEEEKKNNPKVGMLTRLSRGADKTQQNNEDNVKQRDVELIDVNDIMKKQKLSDNEQKELIEKVFKSNKGKTRPKLEFLDSLEAASSSEVPESKVTLVDGIKVVPTLCKCFGETKPKLLVAYSKPEEEKCKVCASNLETCICERKIKDSNSKFPKKKEPMFGGVDMDDLNEYKKVPQSPENNIFIYMLPVSNPKATKPRESYSKPTFSLLPSETVVYRKSLPVINETPKVKKLQGVVLSQDEYLDLLEKADYVSARSSSVENDGHSTVFKMPVFLSERSSPPVLKQNVLPIMPTGFYLRSSNPIDEDKNHCSCNQSWKELNEE